MKEKLYLFILGIILLEYGIVNAQNDSVDVRHSKKLIMIIAPRAFRDEEFRIPYEYLTRIGHKLHVASRDTILATGMLGLVVKPQLLIKEIDTLAYDGIILVGGIGSAIYWDDQIVHRLVNYFARNPPKIVAAICIAPIILARAGVLSNKKATVYEDRVSRAEFKKYKVEYVKKDVVISDNIITAAGPKSSLKFAQGIASVITKTGSR